MTLLLMDGVCSANLITFSASIVKFVPFGGLSIGSTQNKLSYISSEREINREDKIFISVKWFGVDQYILPRLSLTTNIKGRANKVMRLEI